MWANFQRINFLPQKLSLSSQKYGFGNRDPEKTYSGSLGQKGTGSRIRNIEFFGYGSVKKSVPVPDSIGSMDPDPGKIEKFNVLRALRNKLWLLPSMY